MSNYSADELNELLGQFLEIPTQANPAEDVNSALRVAELLESNGCAFSLKDLCPRSMDSLWRASFHVDGREFAAEDAQSAKAICSAAVAALQALSGTA